jgi:drug/metabolite transporter (DMT)-like permease
MAQTATRSNNSSSVTQAILLMLAATLLSAVFSAGSKALVAEYSTTQILFFRCAFALLFVSAFAGIRGWNMSLDTPNRAAHIVRGTLNILSLVLYVWPMAYLPLADVVALSFTQPLFATALAIVVLGERVTVHIWLAVVIGFCGMLIILRPGFQDGEFWMQSAVVLGSLLWAISIVLTRRLTHTESNTTIVFYFLLTGAVFTGVALPSHWTTPSLGDLIGLAGIGLAAACTQFLLTDAYRRAPASVVSPFFYATLIWTTAIGYLVWGEVPDVYVLIGSAMLLMSGIYVAVVTSPNIVK